MFGKGLILQIVYLSYKDNWRKTLQCQRSYTREHSEIKLNIYSILCVLCLQMRVIQSDARSRMLTTSVITTILVVSAEILRHMYNHAQVMPSSDFTSNIVKMLHTLTIEVSFTSFCKLI